MTDKRKLELDAARKVRAMDPRDVTVALWLDSWRVFFPGGRTAETEQHIDYMLRAFRERHGRRLLTALTPLMAQDWATKNPRSVKELKGVWSKALIMGLVPFNIWKVVELPPRRHPPRPVPAPEQLEATLERCRELGGWYLQFEDLLLFTAYTGARCMGVCALKREDVDLEGRRVLLHEKNGRMRRVALLGRALPAMQRALPRAVGPTGHVFRNRFNKPLDRLRVSETWKRLRGDCPAPFHSLRHFAGTWLAANGVNEYDIAIQLGHTDSMGRPYTHLVRRIYVHPDHEPALERIECAIGGANGASRAEAPGQASGGDGGARDPGQALSELHGAR